MLSCSAILGLLLIYLFMNYYYYYRQNADLRREGCAGHFLLNGGGITPQIKFPTSQNIFYILD